MSIFQFIKAWFCFAWLPLYFGGDSSSETKNETNNIDQRVIAEDEGVGVSASGGARVTVNKLDAGSIKQSFGLASRALDKVTSLATSSQSASLRTTQAALDGAFHSIEGTRKAMQEAVTEVATAYEDAKVGNRSIMTIGALLIAAVLALQVFKRKA
jgi:hypothetical protein